MKKSLIAIAVLSAAVFSAHASNVTLYGTVDTGFMYKNSKLSFTSGNIVDLSKKENSFKMADGLAGANKIGIKGEEDIGNLKVGFTLENQFNLSNGGFKESSKLFSREARVYARNELGELSVGHFGGLASAAGPYDIFFKNADAFDGNTNGLPFAFATSGRYDNSIAYQTPEIAGLQGTVMYSFEKDGEQNNQMSNNARYIGAGLTFKQDALSLVGVFETQLRPKENKDETYRNGTTYSIGGNYDFGFAKLFVGAQYARNTSLSDIKQGFDINEIDYKPFHTEFKKYADLLFAESFPQGQGYDKNGKTDFNEYQEGINELIDEYNNDLKEDNDPVIPAWEIKQGAQDPGDIDEAQFKKALKQIVKFADEFMPYNGYALTLGTQVPFGANRLTVAGYMGRYKNSNEFFVDNKGDAKLDIYGFGARYEYFLSKHTTLAVGADVSRSQIKIMIHDVKIKNRMARMYFGLHHTF